MPWRTSADAGEAADHKQVKEGNLHRGIKVKDKVQQGTRKVAHKVKDSMNSQVLHAETVHRNTHKETVRLTEKRATNARTNIILQKFAKQNGTPRTAQCIL